MKILKISLFALLSLIFLGCGKEEANPYFGKWMNESKDESLLIEANSDKLKITSDRRNTINNEIMKEIYIGYVDNSLLVIEIPIGKFIGQINPETGNLELDKQIYNKVDLNAELRTFSNEVPSF